MRTPSPPCDGLDLAHPRLTGSSRVFPIDYGPVLLRRTLRIPSCDGHPAFRGTPSGEPRTGAVAFSLPVAIGWAFASPPQSGLAWLCFLFLLVEQPTPLPRPTR